MGGFVANCDIFASQRANRGDLLVCCIALARGGPMRGKVKWVLVILGLNVKGARPVELHKLSCREQRWGACDGRVVSERRAVDGADDAPRLRTSLEHAHMLAPNAHGIIRLDDRAGEVVTEPVPHL